MKEKNTAYQELLKLVPSFYGNQQLMKKMFDEMMISRPKAVIDAYNKIRLDNPISVLQQIIYNFCGSRYKAHQLQPIIDQYKSGRKVEAIKEIRALTHLGLEEAKCGINDIFMTHPIFAEI